MHCFVIIKLIKSVMSDDILAHLLLVKINRYPQPVAVCRKLESSEVCQKLGKNWGADMSAPQHIGVVAPTGRISSAGEQTCRLPSKLPLGSRQVGYI